ncbi:DUF1573 domain-containing protein [Carboxylicivirga sp. N1Y90]|uniref:DUF1573 domain-containing protein n=1 Tax=Carboxylicivirga fragile TaxID=3417571 RepID=UPI003D3566B2|nr:DUF1573 domain-containing protein [Marinilabiliaceae bacterium N1Y90]
MKLLVTIFLLVTLLGCSSSSSKNEGKGTKGFLSFTEKVHNFGTIKHGDVVGYQFSCVNTGTEPVRILDVKKGCGCTDVKYPEQPVLAGDSAVVELIFDTKGWQGRQVKQVTVLTNDSVGFKELRIWADVN